MSRRGSGDDLGFEVTVNGAQGRRELDAILGKIRQLGNEAVKSGTKIDQSTVDAAKGYNRLANEIAEAIQTEQQLQRSVEATRASRERANAAAANSATAKVRTGTAGVADQVARERLTGAQIANNRALREAETRELEAQSRIALTNDKREDLAQQRRARMAAQQTKAVQSQKKQEDDAWAKRQRDLDAETKAQQRVASETDRAFREREQDRDRERSQIARNAQAELAQIRAAETATERRLAKEATSRARFVEQQDKLYNQYMTGQYNADQAKQNPSIANLNATRYALYDIATTAAIVGTAVSAIGIYASVTASKFEFAFTSVRRAAQLTGDDIGMVRQQLVDLSESVPATFEDIASVATLGAQMNIAGQDLDQFASVVTKFSATTNASIDTTAQTFGRLSSLLDVPATKFENLASAIAEVGVKSVATESEILSTTQQIAGAAAVYGFTADQVVALGAAFASLAIAPEAARGSTTRIFGDIEKAVGEGGAAVQGYADILNMSIEDTSKLWKEDPSAFFQKLIGGLSTSKDLLADLAAIGANDVRDINLLQRLAGSPEVLNNALEISSDAFEKGTYLAEAYAVQTDNLQSKLQVLMNTFNSLAGAAGGPLNEALKIGVDILTYFLQLVGDAPPWLLAVITTLALLVGGFILLKGAQAAAIAGLLAMQTVLKGLSTNAALAGVSLTTLNAVARQTWTMFSAGATSVETATSKLAGFRAAALGLGKAVLPLILVTAALEALSYASSQVEYALSSAASKSEAYLGSFSGLADAMKADTQALADGGTAIATFSGELPAMTEEQRSASDESARLAEILGVTGDAAVDAANKAKISAIAFGDSAAEFIKAQLASSPEFKDAAADSDFVKYWQLVGADVDDAIAAATKDGQAGVEAYFAALEVQAGISRAGFKTEAGYDSFFKLEDGTTLNAREEVDSFTTGLGGLREQAQNVANEALIMGDSIGDAGTQIDGAGDSAEVAVDKMSELRDSLNALFSPITSQADFIDSIDDLFTALSNSGGNFNTFTSEGRAALESLQNTMLTTIEYGATLGLSAQESLEPLFLSLQQQGIDTTTLLQTLAASPIVYTADIDVNALLTKLAAATGLTSGLSSGQQALGGIMLSTADFANKNAQAVKRAGGAAGGAAKQVRTLTDYVGDLGKVFKSAFDIRFGAGKALDDIRQGWLDIAEANQDAADKLADYNADLLDLQSKKQILEYQLGVAIDYGDTLRTGVIQAELAQVTADLAEKQRDADEAAAGMDKSLTGSSGTAIKNRSEILDLVSSYQDYVQQLANTGMTQEQLQAQVAQLRADFIAQAQALGYSNAELQPYIASLNDLGLAIQKVPKNLTITANADPAQRAIDEFLAANRGGKGASGGVSVPISTAFDDAGLKKLARAQVIAAEMSRLQSLIPTTNFSGAGEYAASLKKQIAAYSAQLNSGNYASGGFVPWGKSSNSKLDNGYGVLPTGNTVGLQGGEPIMTNAARSMYGDDFFESVNALKFKPSYSPTIVVQGGGMGNEYADYMSLGPTERGYLAEIIAAIRAGLTISGTAIQKTVSMGTVNDTRRRAG